MINIQKNNFLKGKFCLYCKNYSDALYYFIRAAKMKSIAKDGLIKKKSLKHIFKLLLKMGKKYEKVGLRNLNIEKQIEIYIKENKINKKENIERKEINNLGKIKGINVGTFGQEIEKIKMDIIHDIDECNAKQEKDVLILIDFNIYNKNLDDNINSKKHKIELFIEETILIFLLMIDFVLLSILMNIK